MHSKKVIAGNAVLLLCFAAAVSLLWMLPLLLMGQVYDIYPLLLARNYAVSGVFSLTDELGRFLAPHLLAEHGLIATADGRLSAVFLAWISPLIGWNNFIGWGFVASVTMAVSLVAWWLAAAGLLGRRIAWISTIIIAFMPLYWRQAVWLDSYNFSIPFLFCSFAAFVHLQKRHLLTAVAVSGALFGLSVASKDAFLIFLPWFVAAYFWSYRQTWKNALVGIGVFLFCTGVVYLAPYIGDIRDLGYPVNHNIAAFWPGAEEVREGFYLHLYPDPYTYFFDRNTYDAELLSSYEHFTPLQKLRQQKIFINFDVGEPGVVLKLLNGAWLFAGTIPSFFQQDTVGGVVLWLFIVPGLFLLRRRNGRLMVFALGLILSSELIMRFGLHYARDHLMDYGWVLALLAAVGIAGVADACCRTVKYCGNRTVVAVIVLILCAQLLQANRTVFAKRYSRSFVPQALQLAEDMDTLPDDAVVALGVGASRVEQLAQMSNRTVVPFGEETFERLYEAGTLGEALDLYAVTHLYGYGAGALAHLAQVRPELQVLQEPEVPPATVSPALSYLLHLVR